MTHWRREGAEDGIPLILVHGATVPSWTFDRLVPPLLQAGFQTLRFDLYGHGLSARPSGAYSLERFVNQTIQIIEASHFPRPAIMLGHSFGAVVVAAVAAARPEWISRLVFAAPMLNYNATSSWTKVFQRPGVGELAMHCLGIPTLIRRRQRRYRHIGQAHLAQRFVEQVADGKFARGLLSMIRTGALGDQSTRYAALRDLNRELLLITGAIDAVLPLDHVTRIRSLLPSHTYRQVNAEHNLLLTHPDAVVSTVLDWLS
ncbi:MAG: alpha/beta hydrolase [Steroidobacteraceae bacterium]